MVFDKVLLVKLHVGMQSMEWKAKLLEWARITQASPCEEGENRKVKVAL